MTVRVLVGDVRDRLAELPDESVHCVVTSPPYLGLRDYQVEGQIGLEASPAEYVETMVRVFREIRRVLRSDGTVFLNLGDSYAGSWGNQGRKQERGTQRPINGPMIQPVHDGRYACSESNTGRIPDGSGLKPKDLLGIPWMTAFALRADGWWLRRDIIWHKKNSMPESVRDRPSSAHEYLFLLTKSPTYFYDALAIAEPAESDHPSGNGYKRDARLSYRDENGARGNDQQWTGVGGTRNKRSVWTIATEAFPESHFAVFPTKLVEPCIKAGTSEKGVCAACGAPWVRMREKNNPVDNEVVRTEKSRGGVPGLAPGSSHERVRRLSGSTYQHVYGATLGWQPSCACDAATVPATVLDPFGGAGTTGLVADRLGRDAVLIELNPDYAEMARRRIENDAGMFAKMAEE